MSAVTKRLGDIATVFNGKTPSKIEQRDAGFPVLKIKDVSETGQFRGTFTSFVDVSLANKHSARWVHSGDTLILNAAHNADYVASKMFLAADDVAGVLPTGEWLLVRPNVAEAIPEYLHYWIRSTEARKKIRFIVKGIHLYPKDVAELGVPWVPLYEQRRIVDILSRADGIVRLRCDAEKKAAEIIPALFMDMFGHINPTEYQKIEKLCEFITKGTTPKASEISTTNDGKQVPFLKVLHITDDGRVDFERQPAFVSQAMHWGLLARSVVKTNDVLMNIVGPPLGRICLVPATYSEWNINQALAIFRTKADMFPTFLFHALRSPLVLPNILRLPVGVRQLNISLEQCRNIEVPVPTMNDQRKFVEKAEQARSIQSQQSAATAKAQATFEALLAQVFNRS